jgi:hypothetical protein
VVNQSFFRNLLPVPARIGLSLGQVAPDFALTDVTHQKVVRLANFPGAATGGGGLYPHLCRGGLLPVLLPPYCGYE